VAGGELQPVRVAAGDADRVAVQVLADDRSSRPTTSGSNGSRVLALEAERKKPVSQVMPLPRTRPALRAQVRQLR